MEDKELADRVVALGVGELLDPDYHEQSYYHFDSDTWFSSDFVCSWVVAGALMEKVNESDFAYESYSINRVSSDKSLPRTIVEACVEALDGA